AGTVREDGELLVVFVHFTDQRLYAYTPDGPDAAGLTGLAALGAVLFGASYAWTPVVGWPAVTLFAPPDPGGVAGWLQAPAGSGPAAWTAAALLAGGVTAYAATGPRE
ncbi:hypothetical protein ABZ688_33650, partial [Streptomyces fimicarius]